MSENLSDRQAAEAVRSRIDWKYALSLELTDPGFDFTILSEFRDRLIKEEASAQILARMLQRFQEKGLLKSRGKQRTDSTHVLAKVRELTRLENVIETLRYALNTECRSSSRMAESKSSCVIGVTVMEKEWKTLVCKRKKEERNAWAITVGKDGF